LDSNFDDKIEDLCKWCQNLGFEKLASFILKFKGRFGDEVTDVWLSEGK
jgi:hypothetical protein